jgi:hypothetical protein
MSITWVHPKEPQLSRRPYPGYQKMSIFKEVGTVIWRGGVSVRETPSTDGMILGNLPYGRKFAVHGTVDDFDWAVVNLLPPKSGSHWAFVCDDCIVRDWFEPKSSTPRADSPEVKTMALLDKIDKARARLQRRSEEGGRFCRETFAMNLGDVDVIVTLK